MGSSMGGLGVAGGEKKAETELPLVQTAAVYRPEHLSIRNDGIRAFLSSDTHSSLVQQLG